MFVVLQTIYHELRIDFSISSLSEPFTRSQKHAKIDRRLFVFVLWKIQNIASIIVYTHPKK